MSGFGACPSRRLSGRPHLNLNTGRKAVDIMKNARTIKIAQAPAAYAGSQGEVTMSSMAARYQGTACIITSHNYGHFLAECLESCISQTVPFESVIVVDDASDDDTA